MSIDLKKNKRSTPRWFQSIRGKIILLTCFTGLFASLFIGGFAYFRTKQIALTTAMEGFAGETRLAALRFAQQYRTLENDVFVVSKTPPIKGFVRSVQNDNVDPLDQSTTKLWRTRLETIFKSIMEARPHYTQMRYIGVDDGGRELVRVNRTQAGLQAVPENGLQRKGEEPYFKKSLSQPKGEIFFSEISYNREKGLRDPDLVPTLRAVLPIYSQGSLFGMLIINTDYRQLLKGTFDALQPDKAMYIVNNFGDSMEYQPGRGSGPLQFHRDYSTTMPQFLQKMVEAHEDEAAVFENDTVSYFVRIPIHQENPDAFIGVVLQVSAANLLQEVKQIQHHTLLLSSLIALISLILAAWAAKKMTAPIKQMAQHLANAESYDALLQLPTDKTDEIGEFSKALQVVTQRLLSSQERSQTVLDNIGDGILTLLPDGRIDSANLACEEIFGRESKVLEGMPLSRIVQPPACRRTAFDAISDLNAIKLWRLAKENSELTGIRRDGSVFPLEMTMREIAMDDTKIYTAIVRDITERKEMERMKDDFISTVSHELRTPLTSIEGSLGLLTHKIAHSIDAKGKRLLEVARQNCQRLILLVNDILDMEKIAAGQLEYTLETVELCSLVKQAIDGCQSFADKHGVQFRLQTQVKEAYCRIDSNRMHQALTNLLSNACKFSPIGQDVVIDIRGDQNKHLLIQVIDKGPGIPQHFRDKIFGKFTQAEAPNHENKTGTGLGLNITKSIIEAFGGEITFITKEGQGTTFIVSLPLIKPLLMSEGTNEFLEAHSIR